MALRLGAVFRLGGVGQVLGLLGGALRSRPPRHPRASAADSVVALSPSWLRRPGPRRPRPGLRDSRLRRLRRTTASLSVCVAQRQMIEHGAGQAGEGLLVAQRAGQLLRDPCRRCSSMKGRHRSTAAASEAGGFSPVSFSRTIRPSTSASGASSRDARLGQAALHQALFQAGGEIGRHAFHGERADGFDARLFGGFEHRRAVRRLRAELVVDLFVVIGPAQRIGIAGAAHDRDFAGRQIARRRGQAGLQALAATAARRRN